MTKSVALRACALFALMTLVFAAIGLGSSGALATSFIGVGSVLTLLTAGFASLTPERVPARVASRRRR